jgi:hypothetical protein
MLYDLSNVNLRSATSRAKEKEVKNVAFRQNGNTRLRI